MTTSVLERPLRLIPSPSASVPDASRRSADAGSTSGTSRIRLTRRGRIVFGSLVVVAAMLLFSLGRVSAGADPGSASTHVTVMPGDSLWSVAQRVAPQADPRDEIDKLAAANGLSDGAGLQPGQVLTVPR